MKRHRRAVAATIAVAATAATLAAPANPARADTPPVADPTSDPAVVVQWNAIAMGVLTPSGRPVVTQPFVVAAMHVAMYDAVVAIEGRFEPFTADLAAPAGSSPAAAAASAAHDVLVAYLPGSTSVFDTALAGSLAAIPDGAAQDDGVAVGKAAAQATLAARHDDGSQSGPLPPLLPPGPGVWAPTPPATNGLAPWLAYARPFAMRSVDQFRPPAPPAPDSNRFAMALDEVRRLGGTVSFQRTVEQTTIARFWADQPVAQNQRTLRAHATKLGWDIAATARLFAAVLTSESDAFIACWDAKFHYQNWRPWQSVPTVDPGWTPLLATPNHPEFPSAHGCLTGSLAYALSTLMGTDAIDLDIDAATIGVTRHYDTRRELLDEVRDARIWGGLHYGFSVDTGVRIAHRAVTWNLSHNFRPVD